MDKRQKDYTGLPYPRFQVSNKEHDRTCWVEFTYAENDTELLAKVEAELKKIGWDRNPYPPVPPVRGVAELEFHRDGTDLFNGWTPAEARANTRALMQVLRKFFLPIYRKTLTLGDLL